MLTLIKLLLQEQFHQGLHCLAFSQHAFIRHIPGNTMDLFKFRDNCGRDKGIQIFRTLMVTCLYYISSSKTIFFFLFLNEKICCGYSLEAPYDGTCKEYPQHMFSWRNKKNIKFFTEKSALIYSYVYYRDMWQIRRRNKLPEDVWKDLPHWGYTVNQQNKHCHLTDQILQIFCLIL